jgi:hypothetical protein
LWILWKLKGKTSSGSRRDAPAHLDLITTTNGC